MKRSATVFLQTVIVLGGIGAAALMLLEPHFEGRNAHATFFQVYFNDPFLAYAYTASIAFFVALYQAFKFLGYAGHDEAFTQRSVHALRTIKYCAMSLVGSILAADVYLFVAMRGKEDSSGGIAVGIFLASISVVIATAAAVLERTLQSVIDIKSENDLTV